MEFVAVDVVGVVVADVAMLLLAHTMVTHFYNCCGCWHAADFCV